MVTLTDGDLVTKLMSLSWEARSELLDLLGGPDAMKPETSAKKLKDRLEGAHGQASHGRG